MENQNVIQSGRPGLEAMVGQFCPEYKFTGTKYYQGGVAEYLGQVFGKAIIPGIAAYFAHKAGAPPESLILAPGVLYLNPVYKVAKVLGYIFGKIGKFVGKQIPVSKKVLTVASREEKTRREIEDLKKNLFGPDYHVKVKRSEFLL